MTALPLAADPPAAVVVDPPVDATHPAALVPLTLDVGGQSVNAVFYTAAGPGPHPALLLMHGLPGFEQNLDLAQAARRAGWSVFKFNYRGSWGSHGDFSLVNAITDARTACDWLGTTAAAHRIDRRRIVVAGHSFGGFLAVVTAAANAGLAGVVLLDAWNAGGDGKALAADPVARMTQITDFALNVRPLAGTTATAIVGEMVANADDWDLMNFAPALARQPLLAVGAQRGNGPGSAALAAHVAALPGARVTALTLPTDHSFSDHRLVLATALVRWLETIA